jgi:hypothetical protein
MQEDDRVPTTNGDVTHLAVTDAYATTSMIVFGRNPVRHGIAPLAIRGAVKRGLELVAIPRSTGFKQSGSAPANGRLGSSGFDFLISLRRGRFYPL